MMILRRCSSNVLFGLAFLVVFLSTQSILAQSEVKIWEEVVVLPSYRLNAADLNPMFYKHESYQGAKKKIYPYPFQEHVTKIREKTSYKFLFLENDYIKLSILPELGGRLFSAIDKTNNYEIFYHQHVIKPALIGMLGAWISGGIEWCVFHHHRNTTYMPVDYTLTENGDGSKTIWVGETERRHRMKWLIGITLYPDKSYIEATVKFFNRTPVPHSILYWANVAVHANENYQVIFPPSVEYTTFHSKNEFIHWPVGAEDYRKIDYRDIDLSWWKNHPEPISFFAWDLKEDFMGGYDFGQKAGVVHVANHHIVCGAKLWEFSPGPRGRMWDKILSDIDGPYAELMVGAFSDNQPDYSWIKPYEVKSFKQYWYPIREINGFKNANINAAINLELKDQTVKFGFNTTSLFKKTTAILKVKDKVVLNEQIYISPDRPFFREVNVDNVKETDLKAVLLTGDGKELISYQPQKREYDSELPDEVKAPLPPKKIKIMEQLYLTGLRLQQIHNPSVDPNAYYEEGLRRDPFDTRINTIVGINFNKRGFYEKAEEHLKKAVERLSAEYTRPGNTEAYYHLGLSQKAQGKLNEAYTNFYRATWDYAFHSASYYQLSEISCRKRNFKQALEQIKRALSTNTLNTKAQNVKAAILRKLGEYEKAKQILLNAISIDPLDFMARNELYLILTEIKEGTETHDVLEELDKKMRGEVQSYLELATDYGNVGFWDEAIQVLLRPVELKMNFACTYPMVFYYLGYYYQKIGKNEIAKKYYLSASKKPANYCFPFRMESMEVLENAIELNPTDARAYYYLGNLLYEIQPEKAVKAWEKSKELDDSFAITFRNLGWAYYYFGKNISKAIFYYEKAIECNNQDAQLFYELDRLYERGNISPQQRLALLEKNFDTISKMNKCFVREIIVLALVGQFDKAINYLASNYFHVAEGGGRIHGVFVDAHLLKGLQYYENGKYQQALNHFVKAAEYPENLSVGVPKRDRRAPQVAYYCGMANEAMRQYKTAKQFFEKAAYQEQTENWQETRYYQALAFLKIDEKETAKKIFDNLISSGEKKLAEKPQVDFFSKFGEQVNEQAQQSWAYYILGLGQIGSENITKAKESLEQSVKLNLSNIWAKFHLKNIALQID